LFSHFGFRKNEKKLHVRIDGWGRKERGKRLSEKRRMDIVSLGKGERVVELSAQTRKGGSMKGAVLERKGGRGEIHTIRPWGWGSNLYETQLK